MSLVAMTRREFPARVADLAFSMDVPQHWQEPELPPFSDDWSDPTMFVPLILFVAQTSPIVLTVAARPSYENGTIADWVPWILSEQKMEVQLMSAGALGPHYAFIGAARQGETDIGPMVTRFAFFEDGGRFVNISLIAPEQVSPELDDVWKQMLKTFELKNPRGSTSSPKIERKPDPVVEEYYEPPEPTEQPSAMPPSSEQPAWFVQAKQLELDNKLKEAEQLFKDNIPHQMFAMMIAEMYRDRSIRLNGEGDEQGAKQAVENARKWANHYASQATSGGEGEAMARERDAFLELL